MNREQVIEKAADVLPYHWRINPPGGKCSCGHETPLGRQTTEHVARAVLDAVLPQVSTVTELEAVPEGSLLITPNGEPVRHLYAHARTEVDWLAEYGTLTVVWMPDAGDRS